MTRCLTGRLRVPAPASWALIPYMRWDLRAKRSALERAGAVIAVSEAIATEVRGAGRGAVEVIPNIVNPRELEAAGRVPTVFPLPERFLLYIGKLAANKGAICSFPPLQRRAPGCR